MLAVVNFLKTGLCLIHHLFLPLHTMNGKDAIFYTKINRVLLLNLCWLLLKMTQVLGKTEL